MIIRERNILNYLIENMDKNYIKFLLKEAFEKGIEAGSAGKDSVYESLYVDFLAWLDLEIDALDYV